MKNINIQTIIPLSVYFLFTSCSNNEIETKNHLGERDLKEISVSIDTTQTELSNLGGIGNFFFKDSVITFVDAVTFSFYEFSLDGEYLGKYFQKGKGRNEIPSLMYSYPIENDNKNRCVIIDNSNKLSLFNIEDKNITNNGVVDFGWDGHKSDNYNSTSLYNISSFSDFGVHFYLMSNNSLIFPVNIINRNTNSPKYVDKDRYDDGAIFGELDLNTMKVKKVFGHFPNIYKEKPTPHFETLNYAIKSDTIYVNHIVDSLIYVYKYPDKFLYTLGYEGEGINRNYTYTKDIDVMKNFGHDIQNTGINSGLLICKENNTLCRTYFKSTKNGRSGLQIYDIDTNNLIADIEVPSFFKLLTYRNGYYYGVCFKAIEDEDNTSLLFYKIKVE